MRHCLPRAGLIFAIGMALGSCGTIAFKPGGSADEFQSAKNECKNDPGGQAAYDSCLRAKGWSVAGYNASAAPQPAVQPVPDSPSALKSAQSSPVKSDTPPPVKVSEANQSLEVLSWWRLGSSGEDLKEALSACGLSGRSMHPAAGDLECMTAKGWNATLKR